MRTHTTRVGNHQSIFDSYTPYLTLCKTTNLRQFQTERVAASFKFDKNNQKVLQTGRNLCRKRLVLQTYKKQDLFGKGLTQIFNSLPYNPDFKRS